MKLPGRGGAPTLRGRVSQLALGVIAAWLVILAVGFDLVLLNRLDGQVDDSLRVRAQAASATVAVSGGRIANVRESVTDGELDSSIWVLDGTRVVERPDVSAEVRKFAVSLADRGSGYVTGAEHRFYVLPLQSRQGRAGTVLASANLEATERTRDIVILGSGLVVVLLLLGAYPVLRFAAGRALQPVGAMARQAADWSANSPTERFGKEQHYDELGSLAGNLDEVLDRLSAVLRHERHLSAELSHELRTPLARVAAQVDLVAATARPDQVHELQEIRANCDAMDNIIDALLTAARGELANTVGRSNIDDALAAQAVADEQPRVTWTSSGLVVGVQLEVVSRILSPIIQNGRRYAASEVSLRSERIGTRIAVFISNDGPLVDAAVADSIFDPGYRVSPDDGHDGAGLGLALARRIAVAADGDLTLDSTSPVTTFVLNLPAG